MGYLVWVIVALRVCHGFHCDSSDTILDVRLPRWFVHHIFPDRHELERREEGHLTISRVACSSPLSSHSDQKLSLDNFLVAKSILLSSQYWDSPMIMSSLVSPGRLVTTDNGPAHLLSPAPPPPGPSPGYVLLSACFMSRAPLSLQTALDHNHAV